MFYVKKKKNQNKEEELMRYNLLFFCFFRFYPRNPFLFTALLSLLLRSIYLTSLDSIWHISKRNMPMIQSLERRKEITIMHRLGATKTFYSERRNNPAFVF